MKNNLGYPLVRDTFLVLWNSRCEVLLVLDLKDEFHLLRLSEDSKRHCGMLPYFQGASYSYQRMPMGFNIPSSIWQSYINAILGCLWSRKHCKAIIDYYIWSFVASDSIVLIGEVDRHFTSAPSIQCPIE